ncbi:HesA/MoeB/ThiF family protein [Nostoc sp. DedQUE07]|uniref:HesA/MoeB/ThiF family protein n=1 Tax=Nostoc sp. DedQUE07 TaxID=3075392 RepID=UPI00391BB471
MFQPNPREPLLEIGDPEQDRYASLNLISWWEQERLRSSRVMVVGVGALGNEVLKNLALLGVGKIFIVDFDFVEASNLSRSILFRIQDTGRRKVDVAAERIREINPDVKVVTFHGDIRYDLGLGVVRRMDVVLGCLDNRGARLALNRACYRAEIPWIDGALDILMGMVRVFVPPESACYECGMTEEDYRHINLRYSCPHLRPEDVMPGRIPTTPTSASIIAALQVQEAVKLLHEWEIPAGKAFYFNGQTYKTSLITLNRRQDCPSHETYENIIPLDAGVDDLTVGGLLNMASEIFKEHVVLRLNNDIVQQLFCQRCQHTEVIYRPFEEVIPSLISCPECNSNRIPNIINRLARNSAADISLRQLGVPYLHILLLESHKHQRFVELTKDEDLILPMWNK